MAVVALVACAVPLFFGLDRWDMRNDESIYSYAVQRMLETGDWMTPLSIPTDAPFLEKPPLKFWIVAGAMSLGLTPNDEFGMRVFDAFFGAVAFGYVMAFGWRLAGPVCGAVALLMLFVFDPFVFDHGLRTNNMEAALVLCYCGGLYHVARWFDVLDRRRRRMHAAAVAGYFVLGFMTKFVAALFMPLVALLALALRPGAVRRALATWTDWIWPTIGVLAAVLPWFVYQSVFSTEPFWRIIFGAHVFTRFTASLDPTHLEPWSFYFTMLWGELGLSGTRIITAGGLVLLVAQALRRHALAQLLLLWWIVPYVLISLGTSKLSHYAYPFIPPLALGAGWLCVLSMQAVAAWSTVAVDRALARTPALVFVRSRPRLRVALLAVAVACVGLSVWTLIAGRPLTLEAGGYLLFRNSSILRPALIAVVLLTVTGYALSSMRMASTALLLLILPIPLYQLKLQRTYSVSRPLSAMRDCMLDRAGAKGMYLADPDAVTRQYYYYYRDVGPWETGPANWEAEVTRRLLETRTPVVIPVTQWDLLRAKLPSMDGSWLPSGVSAVFVEPERILLMLPGPYASCESDVLAAGATHYVPPAVVVR